MQTTFPLHLGGSTFGGAGSHPSLVTPHRSTRAQVSSSAITKSISLVSDREVRLTFLKAKTS